jgi:hypothetical protein
MKPERLSAKKSEVIPQAPQTAEPDCVPKGATAPPPVVFHSTFIPLTSQPVGLFHDPAKKFNFFAFDHRADAGP